MAILLTIFSFVGFLVLAIAAARVVRLPLCPVCIGTSGAWLALHGSVLMGWLPREPFLVPVALLMGASFLGIAERAEERVPLAFRYPMAVKAVTVGIGVPLGALMLSSFSLWVWVGEAVALVLLAAFLFRPRRIRTGSGDGADQERATADLADRLKQCC